MLSAYLSMTDSLVGQITLKLNRLPAFAPQVFRPGTGERWKIIYLVLSFVLINSFVAWIAKED